MKVLCYEIINVLLLRLSRFHCPMITTGLEWDQQSAGIGNACCGDGVGAGTI